MAREVTDGEGITWYCIQAFAGLGNDRAKTDAARVDGEADRFDVVCTPSGGQRSVRVQLPGGWEDGLSDDELLQAIAARLADSPEPSRG